MIADEFIAFAENVAERYRAIGAAVAAIDPAPDDTESTDVNKDLYVEAIFLRAFTAYENDLEALFLHYVTGGLSSNGIAAHSFLRADDTAHARRLTRAGIKFLSWAKPSETRTTADTYLRNGWPISSMMSAKAQDLADCERVRNRIAHSSIEADQQFNLVQRNMLQTERIFSLTPGQFLRIRNKRHRKLHLAYYLEVLNETLQAIIAPPP